MVGAAATTAVSAVATDDDGGGGGGIAEDDESVPRGAAMPTTSSQRVGSSAAPPTTDSAKRCRYTPACSGRKPNRSRMLAPEPITPLSGSTANGLATGTPRAADADAAPEKYSAALVSAARRQCSARAPALPSSTAEAVFSPTCTPESSMRVRDTVSGEPAAAPVAVASAADDASRERRSGEPSPAPKAAERELSCAAAASLAAGARRQHTPISNAVSPAMTRSCDSASPPTRPSSSLAACTSRRATDTRTASPAGTTAARGETRSPSAAGPLTGLKMRNATAAREAFVMKKAAALPPASLASTTSRRTLTPSSALAAVPID